LSKVQPLPGQLLRRLHVAQRQSVHNELDRIRDAFNSACNVLAPVFFETLEDIKEKTQAHILTASEQSQKRETEYEVRLASLERESGANLSALAQAKSKLEETEVALKAEAERGEMDRAKSALAIAAAAKAREGVQDALEKVRDELAAERDRRSVELSAATHRSERAEAELASERKLREEMASKHSEETHTTIAQIEQLQTALAAEVERRETQHIDHLRELTVREEARRQEIANLNSTLAIAIEEQDRLRGALAEEGERAEQKNAQLSEALAEVSQRIDQLLGERAVSLESSERAKRASENEIVVLRSQKSETEKRFQELKCAILTVIHGERDQIAEEAKGTNNDIAALCSAGASVIVSLEQARVSAKLMSDRTLGAKLTTRIHRFRSRRAIRFQHSPVSYTEAYRIIGKSGLFDEGFYLVRSPDVVSLGMDPLAHYITQGERVGQAPHPLFDPAYYWASNTDVEASGYSPLVHFIRYGAAEGRWPNPWFDPAWYNSSNPDVADSRMNPLRHYARFGSKEGRQPSSIFDAKWYRARYSVQSELDPLSFHIQFGSKAGFHTNPAQAVLAEKASKVGNQLSTLLQSEAISPSSTSGTSVGVQLRGRIVDLPSTLVASFGGSQFIEQVNASRPLSIKRISGSLTTAESAPTLIVAAHLAGRMQYGGERSFIDILEGLLPLGARIVATIPQDNPDYIAAVRERVSEVAIVPYKWWRNSPLPSPQEVATFIDLFRSTNATAVHANTIVLRAALVAARLEGVVACCHVREIVRHDEALQKVVGLPHEQTSSLVASTADWIVANSQATAAEFRSPEKTVVLPNTVDLDLFDIPNMVDPKEVKFGLISSNLPKKGVEDFVALAKACYQDTPNAKFILVGQETDLIRRLKEEKARTGQMRNVAFVDYQADALQAISRVNVVVNFSIFAESFGRTVLEGMAARRPAIVYDWGALPELIDHGVNGYRVPYRQFADAAQWVKALCRDTSLIRTMGEAGRHAALDRYAKGIYSSSICRLYREIFRSRETPSESPTEHPGNAGHQRESLSAKDRGLEVLAASSPPRRHASPTRIAYFVWHFPVPSETFVLRELRELVSEGHDVKVYCRQCPYPDFKPDFPITWERVSTPPELASRLASSNCTVAHGHFVYPTVTDFLWPACVEAGIPFTFIAHAQDIFKYENDKKNRIGEIATHHLCKKVFVLSRFHRNYLIERGVPRAKIVINPNAIEPNDFISGWVDDRASRKFRRVAAIQRFVEKKGIKELISAAKLLDEAGVTIDLYGYGPLETEYRRQIAREGIDNVEIRGQLNSTEDLNEVFRTHDLLVCPSVRTADGDMDGIPTTILEALAAGLPVLATPISGIPDVVQHDVNGLLCEATPTAIAGAIKRFYRLNDSEIESMIEAGRTVVRDRFSAARLTRVLLRVWHSQPIDIVIVSWNNLRELKEVVSRLYRFTSLPFQLTICDNNSEPGVKNYLRDLWKAHDNATVIYNPTNSMVGPGTNLALAHGSGDIAVYVCGKEGFVFNTGWELPFVHVLAEDSRVGICGTLIHSPTYLLGEQYPTGISNFGAFRNTRFATDNPKRVFRHVQGGIFAMRRAMVEEIGGFNEHVPHNHTDVEYSYYAESMGWRLAEVPHLVSIYSKTRPTLSAHFDETIYAAHPTRIEDLQWIDRITEHQHAHCNVCDFTTANFPYVKDLPTCPKCHSTPADRTAYRWLSRSTLLHRRLSALAVGIQGSFGKIWTSNFKSNVYSLGDTNKLLMSAGRFPNRDGGLEIVLVRARKHDLTQHLEEEIERLLKPGGLALLQVADQGGPSALRPQIGKRGLVKFVEDVRYQSAALQFDKRKMSVFQKH
jgi:glycosyltransferase involved in cell wall biosynthesis/GT2 family glycosyltransferase